MRLGALGASLAIARANLAGPPVLDKAIGALGVAGKARILGCLRACAPHSEAGNVRGPIANRMAVNNLLMIRFSQWRKSTGKAPPMYVGPLVARAGMV